MKFGIPTLDYLIGYNPTEQESQAPDDNKSVCIVGPPGTSKSLLAVHLACTFAWTNKNSVVIYASTDWRFELAKKAVHSFGLDSYGRRIVNPLNLRLPEKYQYLKTSHSRDDRIDMHPIDVEDDKYISSLKSCIEANQNSATPTILFLDLQAGTTGDDWNHILRLTQLVPQLIGSVQRSLVIVDAVEGIELLAGDSDQFGQPRSRRQRIAQFARIIGASNWALVIEDRGNSPMDSQNWMKHYDEEFISDVVVRVGVRQVAHYAERYVEISKSRGSVHQLGKHPLLLRNGAGSRSSFGVNQDDPAIRHPTDQLRYQSYIYAVPSIHSRAAALLTRRKGTL